MSCATLLVLAILLELGVRLLVPESTFWFLANVYAKDEDPDVGYRMRPSLDASAFGVALRTNEDGFRGPQWSPRPRAGTTRVALIGDSHAFGYGVAFEQTFGEVLARLVAARTGRPCEVLNFGVSGHNSAQELAVLERHALRYAPDIVIAVPCHNDADAALVVDEAGWLSSAGASAETGAGEPWQDRAFERFRKSAFGKSRLLLWLRVLWYRASRAPAPPASSPPPDPRLSGDWFEALPTDLPAPAELVAPVLQPLARMIALCRARGIAFVLAPVTPLRDWRLALHALAREQDVPIVELLRLLPRVRSNVDLARVWSLGWDTHMNAGAHALWAAGIDAALVERGLPARR